MFLDATSFNQPLNNWNVSNVIAMYKMFNWASSFNQSLDNWNVCSIISGTYSMDNMFNWASSFDQNIHSWLVPNKSSKPTGFDTWTPAGFINNSAKQPQWWVACQ
jgi:surface protein